VIARLKKGVVWDNPKDIPGQGKQNRFAMKLFKKVANR
jgi:hypothetical protein